MYEKKDDKMFLKDFVALVMNELSGFVQEGQVVKFYVPLCNPYEADRESPFGLHPYLSNYCAPEGKYATIEFNVEMRQDCLESKDLGSNHDVNQASPSGREV